MAALEDLADWFIMRADDQGFGELRDQLVSEFPQDIEEPLLTVEAGVVGTGSSVAFGSGSGSGCSSGSSSGSDGNPNYPPEAVYDEYSTRMNTTYEYINDYSPTHPGKVGVLFNDTDPEGDQLWSYVYTLPSHGLLTLHQNGGIIYEPDDGYIGADMFYYTATDGLGCDTAPVTIYVYDPDIDVDSNNNGTIDHDNSQAGTDDWIEDEKSANGVPRLHTGAEMGSGHKRLLPKGAKTCIMPG